MSDLPSGSAAALGSVAVTAGTDQKGAAAGERIVWIDYARGIGITLVVLGHVIRGLRINEVGPTLLVYERIDGLIYTFHMPLFFFLSGLLFAARPSLPPRRFAQATLVGLIVPYVLWSVIFVAVQKLGSHGVNRDYEFELLAWMWRYPIAHMWFLYALFFAHVAAYLAGRFFSAAGLAILFALWVALYLYSSVTWLDSIAPGLTMGGAFLMSGVVISWYLRRHASWWLPAAVAAVACVIWIMDNFYLEPNPRPEWPPLAAISGTAMTVAACLLLRNWRGLGANILAQIGQASIAIYVTHVIFAAALRILFYDLRIFDCTLHVVAGTLAGVLIPAVLFVLANKAGIAPYVGFGRTQKFLYVALPMKAA